MTWLIMICSHVIPLIVRSLLVISELTLFFDEDRTEMAIGLSLTIMLVMYTLYQERMK